MVLYLEDDVIHDVVVTDEITNVAVALEEQQHLMGIWCLAEVVGYDFVPTALSILQDKSIMTQTNLAINFNNPLARYQSPNGRLTKPCLLQFTGRCTEPTLHQTPLVNFLLQ